MRTEQWTALVAERIAFARGQADWYRRKKEFTKGRSLTLKISSAILLVFGATAPLVAHLASAFPAELGYVLLSVSGGFYMLDRVFDQSGGWLRQMIAAQEIEAELEIFRIKSSFVEMDETDDESEQLLLDFTAAVSGIIRAETLAWERDAKQRTAELESATLPSVGLKGSRDGRPTAARARL